MDDSAHYVVSFRNITSTEPVYRDQYKFKKIIISRNEIFLEILFNSFELLFSSFEIILFCALKIIV